MQKKYMTRCLYQWNETSMKGPGNGKPISVNRAIFRLHVEYNIRNEVLSLRIQNQCQQPIVLRSILIFYGTSRKVDFFKNVVRMVPGYEFQYDKKFLFLPDQEYKVLILSQLAVIDYQLREITNMRFLIPRKPRGVPLKLKKLPSFDVPDYVKAVHLHNYEVNPHYSRNSSSWLERFQSYKKQGLKLSNYTEYLRMLNQVEQYSMYLEMQSYTIEDARLTPTNVPKQYLLSIEQFKKAPVLLDVGNYLCATTAVINRCGEDVHVVIRGSIVERKSYFTLEMETDLPIGKRKVKLEFIFNHTQFQMEYLALNYLHRIDFSTLVFPTLENQTIKKKGVLISRKHTQFTWFQDQIGGNKLQQVAIANIVNRTAYPAPYILFGPPGTGKTSTIVEAVLQIYKLQPKSRILLTASSNFACNELTKRLLKFVPSNDIFRYISMVSERDINSWDLDILQISNMYMGSYQTPSIEDFVKTRILVCTIVTSARLIQTNSNPSIYDYIFIDECGSLRELSALVPIVCIGTEENKNTLQASVVIAGDPKQLGPVCRIVRLQQTVHTVSLLERLMNLPYYKKDLNNNEYNTEVVTKLLDNYRSHRSLFEFSNKEFYEGELRAKGSSASTEWAIGWKCLPNPKFPIIFHAVVGTMVQDKISLSYLNCDEAHVVYQYVQQLVNKNINGRIICEEDIGIITPYSRQVEYIKNGLSNLGLDNIEVGSAEQYQGREKPVIIISTVRSNRRTVGFLADQKRLNVVMTRAMGLQIIIGNPKNLMQDPTWCKLLKFLKSNNVFIGRNYNLDSTSSTYSYSSPASSNSTISFNSSDFA